MQQGMASTIEYDSLVFPRTAVAAVIRGNKGTDESHEGGFLPRRVRVEAPSYRGISLALPACSRFRHAIGRETARKGKDREEENPPLLYPYVSPRKDRSLQSRKHKGIRKTHPPFPRHPCKSPENPRRDSRGKVDPRTRNASPKRTL